jgi:neutral ceramidase
LAAGKIYVNRGDVQDCGGNRSLAAYKENKSGEWPTDKEMLLLRFVHLVKDERGFVTERPIALLNWYAIHPTDRGQQNTLVCGDNKGEASRLIESTTSSGSFVAAFANSNCGDVSGSVIQASQSESTFKRPDNVHDAERMREHGKKQADVAWKLVEYATEELKGSIDYRCRYVHMSSVAVPDVGRTWPAALGLSFAAGSTEDGIAKPPTIPPLAEGISIEKPSRFFDTQLAEVIVAMRYAFGSQPRIPDEVARGHFPKPIVLVPEFFDPPLTTSLLPLQLLKIGNLIIAGIPGEITTMAGRRLKKAILDEHFGAVNYLALATYANEYSQYITTNEEYRAQHYEGASTLFGPHTLAAYQQEFKKLAKSLKERVVEPWGKEKHSLESGDQLYPWESIWSPSGEYELRYQDDNNLVLYKYHKNGRVEALWNSKTNIPGRPACLCVMQADGNLVIYDVFGKAFWESRTRAQDDAGSKLVLRDGGERELARPNGQEFDLGDGYLR